MRRPGGWSGGRVLDRVSGRSLYAYLPYPNELRRAKSAEHSPNPSQTDWKGFTDNRPRKGCSRGHIDLPVTSTSLQSNEWSIEVSVGTRL